MLLKNKTIFIVEDNMQNRVVFQMALLHYGVLLDFERLGAGTMARLKNIPTVDLIILDLMLAEGVSGFDLYDEIRTIAAYVDVPIIAVSAMDPSMVIPKLKQKGFSGFITKPIDRKLFPTQVADIMTGVPVWDLGRAAQSL